MRYNEENLKSVVKTSNSITECVEKLGLKPFCGNRNTVEKYIKRFNINIEHFGNYRHKTPSNKKDLNDILTKNSAYNNGRLKKRLYDEGLKERKCELCGQDEYWFGKKISLILDHINGVHSDNRIENLRIVCPNCNATLETHGGKNIKRKPVSNKEIKHCKKCGKVKKSDKGEYCLKCIQDIQRKVERPPYEQLIKEIKELGYTGTGRKYGVSDNAIRKWKKKYEKNNKDV